jgi:hypothetical protein
MFANFAALAGPGSGALGLLRAPLIFLVQVATGGLALGLLVPAAVVACALALRRRDLPLEHQALFLCVPLLAALCADPGVDYNHLLDLVVLCVLVAGHLWQALPAVAGGLAVALGWVLFAGWVGVLEPRLREVGYRPVGEPTRYPAVPLAGWIGPAETILTENPWIDVSRGRTPVVLDAFAFARLTRSDPALAAPLLKKIRQGSFDKIILRRRLDDPASDRARWEEQNFGRPVLAAVAERYRLLAEAEGFFIYVPRE